jgi:ubiquinone/menaquinone biosynthesis C-methylase UbiE
MGRHDAGAWSLVARGWGRRWPVFEEGAGNLSRRMVELADIGPGDRVLDVATGVGEPALTAARTVAPGGHVLAVDQSPAMVELAARRAREAELDHVETTVSSAEELDTAGRRFDAVLCRWGLMLFQDPDAALSRMREVLVADGRLVAAVWGDRERMPLLAILGDAVREAFQAPEPEPGEPHAFAMTDAGALAERVTAAGFTSVRTERVVCPFTFDSPRHYRLFEEEVSLSLVSAIRESPDDRVALARRIIEEGAARHADSSGRVTLPCEAIVVSALRGD